MVYDSSQLITIATSSGLIGIKGEVIAVVRIAQRKDTKEYDFLFHVFGGAGYEPLIGAIPAKGHVVYEALQQAIALFERSQITEETMN